MKYTESASSFVKQFPKLHIDQKGVQYPSDQDETKFEPASIADPSEVEVTGNQNDIAITFRNKRGESGVIHLHGGTALQRWVELNEEKMNPGGKK